MIRDADQILIEKLKTAKKGDVYYTTYKKNILNQFYNFRDDGPYFGKFVNADAREGEDDYDYALKGFSPYCYDVMPLRYWGCFKNEIENNGNVYLFLNDKDIKYVWLSPSDYHAYYDYGINEKITPRSLSLSMNVIDHLYADKETVEKVCRENNLRSLEYYQQVQATIKDMSMQFDNFLTKLKESK